MIDWIVDLAIGSKPAPKSPSSSLTLLFELMKANNWKKVKRTFFSNTRGEQIFQSIAAEVQKNGMSIIHVCARFNPPSVLFNSMIKLCPNAPRSRDCFDRTPLHVAASTGASTAVLKLLIDSYPDACEIRDKDVKTPLHLACDISHNLFIGSLGDRRRLASCSYPSIAILLKGSYKSAIMEDKHGLNAIAYAFCSGADHKTMQRIQIAAQKATIKKHQEDRLKLRGGWILQ